MDSIEAIQAALLFKKVKALYQPSSFLRRAALLFPHRLALVAGGKEYTYRQVNELANRIAQALANEGVRQGDRVAYLIGNNPASLVVYQAAQKAGAVAVPLNKRLMAEDIGYMLERVEAKMLIFDEDVRDNVRAAVRRSRFDGTLVVIGGTDHAGFVPWDEFKESGSPVEVEVEVAVPGDAESLILFSSGTCGRPKAVMRTADAVSMLSLVQAAESGTVASNAEVLYTQAPLFHLGGYLAMLKAVALGETLVLETHFCPERVFSLVERYEVTQLYMIPPALFRRLRASEARRGRVFRTVRQAQCAGGKPTREDVEAVFEVFPESRLRVSFGSTEAGALTTGFVSQAQFRERPERALSIGVPNVTVEMRLVAEDGSEALCDETGEAYVKSPLVFKEYVGDPALTRAAFDEEGFYRTGDLMRRDAEGFYTFVDRTGDVVKTGGENVCSTDVEEVLRQYPGIRDCAVVGVPDGLYGEGIAAAVVIEESGEGFDARGIADFCRSRMPGFWKPRYLAIIDELPRNSIGKIQKSALRDHPELFTPLDL